MMLFSCLSTAVIQNYEIDVCVWEIFLDAPQLQGDSLWLLSVCDFTCSPCVCMGFLRALWFPPKNMSVGSW